MQQHLMQYYRFCLLQLVRFLFKTFHHLISSQSSKTYNSRPDDTNVELKNHNAVSVTRTMQSPKSVENVSY